MNPSNRFLVFMSVAVVIAASARAMPFEAFDHLRSSAQAEFIADMVDRTEQALSADGNADLASKTDQLFAVILPGDKISVGLAELESNVARARAADLDRIGKDPQAQRVEVEDALFVTLKKNGIELSDNAIDGVLNASASFHQMSNAEFLALPPSGRRHSIRLFSEIAFFDYAFRDMVETKKNSFFDLGDQSMRDLAEIMSTQFPSSGDQPGFENAENAVEADNAKTPNDAVFFTFAIYVLDEIQKRVAARNQDLVDRAVLLPDGRHAYRDNDGDFWIYPGDELKSDDTTKYKLEANLQPLAKRLAECMETGGITDGPRAQIACLDRVAGVRPAEPDAVPATLPPAVPVAPSPPPASPPDDDPIGAGGFITPPK